MLKSQKKSVLNKIIAAGKLNSVEAEAAHILQSLFLDEETATSHTDSLSGDYIPNQHKISSIDDFLVFKDRKKNAMDAYKRWYAHHRSVQTDPMSIYIVKAVLHYNVTPLDIAKELTGQLYQHAKISSNILRHLNVKISCYQVERILKQSLLLYAEFFRATHEDNR